MIKVGIAGLGVVGSSVFNLLLNNQENINKKTGVEIKVTAVAARDKGKQRGLNLSGIRWYENAPDMADDAEVDVVVELIGGAEGTAFDLVSRAIKNNKQIVTANKAMLALRGQELLDMLENSKSSIHYEAAVAGGIPAIKVLREGLAANNIRKISGILNGTCNFILSEMLHHSRSFDDVLHDAQAKGYAEADPTFDIEGFDSAHKLAILSALAFGGLPDVSAIKVRGISKISLDDIKKARAKNHVIKLLCGAEMRDGAVEASVSPVEIPLHDEMARVDGALNAVCFEGDFAGRIFISGAGAGGNATASAVVADIIDIARGNRLPLFN